MSSRGRCLLRVRDYGLFGIQKQSRTFKSRGRSLGLYRVWVVCQGSGVGGGRDGMSDIGFHGIIEYKIRDG